MAFGVTDDKHYKNIAERIRAHDVFNALDWDEAWKKPKLKPEEMTNAIDMVIAKNNDEWENYGYYGGYIDGEAKGRQEGYTEGYEEGHTHGISDGYADGLQKGEEIGLAAGRQEAYDTFWDAMQGEGRRSNYTGAFEGIGWTEATLKPKYNMKKIQYANRMFRMSRVEQPFNTYFFNMGVEVSFQHCLQMDSCFASSFWTQIDDLDTMECENLEAIFSGCTKLRSIGLYLTYDGSQNLHNSFTKCSALTDVDIYQGEIGYDGVNFSYSQGLTARSIKNIINALSTTVSGATITLSKTAVNNAFINVGKEQEWLNLINSKPNWNIVLKN